MASPAQATVPKKPSAVKFYNMISGARVDVIVGAEKKHYTLPRDLLSYYSPYFEKCFSGSFKEGKELKLELLEDRIEDFEILLEVILRASVESIPAGNKDTIRSYMSMIEYADRFEMGELYCALLYDRIWSRLLGAEAAGIRTGRTQPNDIELVFRVTRDGNPLRTLVTQDVISFEDLTGRSGNSALFRLKEKEIPKFAFEMLRQFRLSVRSDGRWKDPLTGAVNWNPY